MNIEQFDQYMVNIQHDMLNRFTEESICLYIKELKDEAIVSLLAIYQDNSPYGYNFKNNADNIMLRPLDEINLKYSSDFFDEKCICIGELASGDTAIMKFEPHNIIYIIGFGRENEMTVYEEYSVSDFVSFLSKG